ncbi:MAG: SAM-dependent methyltransferase [Desulfomicrobium escambiense]|nr:SAM-dependent methyltransferase [Desulfomicrobium escambiense]
MDHIDFTRKVGDSSLSDAEAARTHPPFRQVPPAQRRLRARRPARLGLRVPDLHVRGGRRAQRRRLLHPPRCGAHDGAPPRSPRGAGDLRSCLRVGRYAHLLQASCRGARRRRSQPLPPRPGLQRLGLGRVQDEHDPQRDLQGRDPQRRHARPSRDTWTGAACAASTWCCPIRRFGINYSREGMEFPERFRYGFCPETGKKAELMFIQHMHAVLRPRGLLASVAPHGVLFRGGQEARDPPRLPR